MRRLENSTIVAINQLKRGEMKAYFAEFLKWVKESLEDQREANDVELKEPELRQGQGKAQILKEILTTVDEAERITNE